MGVIETLSMPVVWLIALVIFALAEAATVSLVSIWFAAGALAALVVSLFTDNLFVQCAVFLAVSALCMALVRPLAQKRFSPLPHQRTTNLDRLIGTEAVVTETIDNLAATGQVKASGQIWTARTETDEPVPVGTVVTVLRIEGVKMIVQVMVPATA